MPGTGSWRGTALLSQHSIVMLDGLLFCWLDVVTVFLMF